MPKQYFTTTNAREMSAKANQVRWSRYHASQVPADNLANPAATPKPVPDDYVERRIGRVRKQINKIDSMLLDELDPTKLDRLASAATRLAEVERVLSGRALPGSLKPRNGKPHDRNQPNLAPVAATPSQPVTVPDKLDLSGYSIT